MDGSGENINNISLSQCASNVTVDKLQAGTCYNFNIMTCKPNNAINECRIVLAVNKNVTIEEENSDESLNVTDAATISKLATRCPLLTTSTDQYLVPPSKIISDSSTSR